ncbi:speckle-type POZ protein A-like [Fopius arisanus]|uniref:Speckle-type POZ protein A-like n=1 Tax=Fopius arisanus TaxID=64838 RepID=A0A9R1T827_9HYME|nr:PREDICTED: speckle-type POZ protein A-like [Fopius arisanus]
MANCDAIYETRAKVMKHNFKWMIREFSEMMDKRKSLRSKFSVPGCSLDGCLELFPLGNKFIGGPDEIEFLDLDVHVHFEDDPIHSDIEVSILGPDGEKHVTRRRAITPQVGLTLPLPKMKNFFPEDVLTLSFLVSITTDVRTTRRKDTCLVNRGFEGDLEKLLDNPQVSDIAITVGGRKFWGVRALLAARSPVFAAILGGNEGDVVIEDVEEDVFEEVLHFLHTDRVRNPEDRTEKLLHAGQKFGLKRLVQMIGLNLLKDLTTDNVAERLLLAHEYLLQGVKDVIIRFIKGRVKAVVQTQGYKKLVDLNCPLALEIFQAMALE